MGTIAARESNMRHLHFDEEGQASVIGTIMAIMVVLAFLSLFTTQYMPVAMSENEANHMNNARTQFALFRQTIDTQILADEKSMTMYSPITLGAENIPVFTAPTFGQMFFEPKEAEMGIELESTYGPVSENSTGMIWLYCPNRYYVSQTLIFENGAIITAQKGNSQMNVGPHINFVRRGAELNLSVTLIDLFGTGSSVTDYGTRGIETQLEHTVSQDFDRDPNSNVTFTITTDYAQAWEAYFNRTLQGEGFVRGVNFNVTVTGIQLPGDQTVDRVTVTMAPNCGIDHVQIRRAIIEVTLGNE